MEQQGFFTQFREYLKGRLRYIIIPVIVLLVLLIAIILLTPGSGIGRFVYSFF